MAFFIMKFFKCKFINLTKRIELYFFIGVTKSDAKNRCFSPVSGTEFFYLNCMSNNVSWQKVSDWSGY